MNYMCSTVVLPDFERKNISYKHCFHRNITLCYYNLKQKGKERFPCNKIRRENDEHEISEITCSSIHGTEKVSTLDHNDRRLDVQVLTSTGAGYVPADNYTIQ